MQQNAGTDTFSFTNVVGSDFIQDSVTVEVDSLLLTPSDSLFRFFEVKLPEKLFIGHAGFPRDTTYYEQLQWKGMPVFFREKYESANDWLTIMLFLLVVLLASVRTGYNRYIGTLFHSLVSYSASVRMFREKNYSFIHGSARLELLFYMIISVFAFQIFVNVTSDNQLYSITGFGVTFAVLLFYFIAKKLLYKALGTIFIGATDTSELVFNMDNYNRATGIVLLPVVAVIAFNPFESAVIAIVTGVSVFAVFYIFLLKRCISILLKKQISILYLFLYLCTLEFLPLLMIYKLAVKQAG